MPKAPPRDPRRAYKTRVDGLCRKISELHGIDPQIRIALFVERPGITPLVFTTDECGLGWPCGAEEFVCVLTPRHAVTNSR
jgi:hypothetical protein